jgi:hypothetical protein
VMGLVGSRRPALIHSWMRFRLMGDISTEKLCILWSANLRVFFPLFCLPLSLLFLSCSMGGCDLLVHLSSLARNHNLRRLATIEAEWHLSVRLLTLVTSSGRLALAGTGTATAADAVAVCSLGV